MIFPPIFIHFAPTVHCPFTFPLTIAVPSTKIIPLGGRSFTTPLIVTLPTPLTTEKTIVALPLHNNRLKLYPGFLH